MFLTRRVRRLARTTWWHGARPTACALGFALGLAAAPGCGPSDTEREAPAEPAAAPTADAPAAATPAAADDGATMEAARAIFEGRCATCHGMTGAGDGPGSAALDPKPRDFRDPEWQESVTDEHIQQVILYGGAAVGRSPAMPGNPDLMAKPDVTAALVQHVRSLEQP